VEVDFREGLPNNLEIKMGSHFHSQTLDNMRVQFHYVQCQMHEHLVEDQFSPL
jgi:hypothetical protein